MMKNQNHIKYRPDIDGLRAVAILTVVLYHAFPKIMPGGFIGVDIFFVISGFLISTIIFTSFENDSFSLGDFYVRRVRRIFPALILVLIFCLILGRYVMFPAEYSQLGKHSAAGAGFVQNIILWRESGYFDNLAETKPLLHFWSLAVEEQFYIFWPLLLALFWKGKWNFFRIIAVILILSFGVNIYLLKSGQSSSAFYLPFSRFWELMIGSVLAYLVLYRSPYLEKQKNLQSFLGFALILAGLVLINKGKQFPGWWALLPVVGAFFILSAGPNSYLNKKLLANKLMVGIGLISYPLYLWHWPLLSFLQITQGQTSNLVKVAAVIVAIVLAWLSYQFVEKPIRNGKRRKVAVASLVSTMALIFIVGEINYKTDILKKSDNRTKYVQYFENAAPKWQFYTKEHIYENYRMDCDFYDVEKYKQGKATSIPRKAISKSCYTRNPSYPHSVLIWGDSHAQHLYYGLKNNLPKDWQILLSVGSGCYPTPDVIAPSDTYFCQHSNWLAMQIVKKAKPDVVIIAQLNRHSVETMNHIASKLKKMGVKKILFLGPVPQWEPYLYVVIAQNFWKDTPRHTFKGLDKKIIKLNNELVANFKESRKVNFVNLIDFFCNNKGCLTYIGNDKRRGITSIDYGHLSLKASDKLAKELLVNKIIS